MKLSIKQTDRPRGKTVEAVEGRGTCVRELGISKLLCIKQINKDLLYDTGIYIQYPVVNHNGKEYEKEHI